MKKRIIIFTTGGTIAMKYSNVHDGLVPAVSGQDLIEAVPELEAVCDIDVQEFSNMPSCQMTPDTMLQLAVQIESVLVDDTVAGVVITHGTDTMEETAYFLDLVIHTEKPIVLTAAMRSASEISPDGSKNILCAIKTAASDVARHCGVLVVMNEQIHAAAQVTKTHTANTATFASPWWGPLGYIDEDRIIVRRQPQNRMYIRPSALGGQVYLLPMVTGCDTLLLETLIAKKVAGIVIEAFGRGNMPPIAQECMGKAIKAGIPVVLVSRCGSGRTSDTYGYIGGGKISHELGAIFAGETSGIKARLKLMLALGITHDHKELQKYFDV